MIFSMTSQERWPFNIGDCLIEVTAWAGLTVHVSVNAIKNYINVQWRQFADLYFQHIDNVNLNWSSNMLYRITYLKKYITFPNIDWNKTADIKTLQNSTDITSKIQKCTNEYQRNDLIPSFFTLIKYVFQDGFFNNLYEVLHQGQQF